MRWAKVWKTVMWFVAVLSFTGMIPGVWEVRVTSYATQEMELDAMLEELENSEGSEDIPEDEYDQDIDQFIQQYFEKMERGEITVEGFETNEVINPKLVMEHGNSGRIRYRLPNGISYEATVPNGMITSDPVTFYPPDGIVGVVTRDDNNSSVVRSWHFREPGSYQIQMIFYRTNDLESTDYSIYEVNHSFTIVEKKTGKVGAVTAPDGFSIVSVKCDGVSKEIEHSQCMFLHEDGMYEIRYRDLEDGSIYISSSFELDTQAPFLSFSEEIENGAVTGPVEFYTSEVGNGVTVSFNGNTADAVTNVLKTAGSYVLNVYDDAGNSRIYTVTIRQTFKLLDTRMIILAAVILIITIIRLILLRRDMRVI